jgi:hypothetical protein
VTNKQIGRSEYRGAIPDKGRTLFLDIVKTCCGGSASFFSHCLIVLFPGGGVKSLKRETPFNAEIER